MAMFDRFFHKWKLLIWCLQCFHENTYTDSSYLFFTPKLSYDNDKDVSSFEMLLVVHGFLHTDSLFRESLREILGGHYQLLVLPSSGLLSCRVLLHLAVSQGVRGNIRHELLCGQRDQLHYPRVSSLQSSAGQVVRGHQV